MASDVARSANREIGVPRKAACGEWEIDALRGGYDLVLSAVGELVGAAEVLGYFWDAEKF